MSSMKRFQHIHELVKKCGLRRICTLSSEELSALPENEIALLSEHICMTPGELKKYIRKQRRISIVFHPHVLIRQGVIKLVERNGYKYIMLGEEILDPKKYVEIYREIPEAYPTLFKEYGLEKLYEKHKDIIIAPPPEASDKVIGEIETEHIIFSIEAHKKGEPVIIGKLVFNVDPEKEELLLPKKFSLLGDSRLYVNVTDFNPDENSIERITNYIEQTLFLIKEYIFDLINYLKREIGSIVVDNVSGEFEVTIYKQGNTYIPRITFSDLTIEAVLKARDKVKNMIVFVSHDYVIGRSRVDVACQYIPDCIRRTFSSIETKSIDLPLQELVENPIFKVNIWTVPSTEYIGKFIINPVLLSTRKFIKAINNLDHILRKVLKEHIKRIWDKEITPADEHSQNITVGELLESIKWKDTMSTDEVILKLLATKYTVGMISDPPVFDMLLSDAILSGHSYYKIMRAINKPLKYLISLVRRGDIRIRPNKDRGYSILYKGKPLKEIIDGPKISMQFYNLIYATYMLARPEEELKQLRKKEYYIA